MKNSRQKNDDYVYTEIFGYTNSNLIDKRKYNKEIEKEIKTYEENKGFDDL